jgi:hypothetical protein
MIDVVKNIIYPIAWYVIEEGVFTEPFYIHEI